MKHKTHMNRFTALNKTVALSLAAAGLVSASPAFAAALTNASYVSINDNNEPVRGNYDSKGATGRYGVAVGVNASAQSLSTVAIGSETTAKDESATAVGTLSKAEGTAAAAFGQGANATANAATAIGRQAAAKGNSSTAVGSASVADGLSSTAFGSGSNATAPASTAVGQGTQATGAYTVAVGQKAQAKGISSAAVGSASVAEGNYSIATGAASQATGNASVASGLQAQAKGGSSVAIGRGAIASDEYSVALGAGSTTSTAVGTNTATVNGVTYSGFAGTTPTSTVSVGSAGNERTVTNVAAGRITPTSTDAINGSQLYQVAAQTNGNSVVINNLQDRINDMNKDLRAGIAGATAIGFLQRPNEAGKSIVSAAVGGYRGQQAIAVGYAHNSDNNKWSIKTGVSVNTRKDVNWGGSVGYQW
ncbi:YadA-like family protein [Neisseria sp. HMSC064E01]|uniref:YadA family autotransporter adhesin n=1 Tax=Neisseria sp. HMSC064E01 TaxID=1715052 RepID=UPI0008A1F963|nr:YadA-like family protein [Neisseria sp. HMSC064E01]OFN84484.1 calcium-binding protein [Neisseria sp. HMSC064E01]